MQETLKQGLETVNKMPDGEVKTNLLPLISVYQMWKQKFDSVNANTNSLLSDLNLYIETLEKYSAELDGTLCGIFSQAQKMAEQTSKQLD